MKRKFLITGSNGFVGKQVTKFLNSKNLDINIIVREKSELDPILSECANKIYYTKDLFSETVEWWVDKCKGVDVVLHLLVHGTR